MKAAPVQHNGLVTVRSIRWRLPMTYAGIALLTAIALGGLLLFTLNNYYKGRESEYLEISSQLLASQAASMIQDDLPAENVRAAVDVLSLLAQARVQLFDESAQLLFDSGPMDEQNQISVRFYRDEQGNTGGGPNGMGPFLSVQRDDEPATEEAPGLASDGQVPPPRYDYPFEISRGAFGQLRTSDVSPGKFSGERVKTVIYTQTGEIIGCLELSEGPAFGREIVEDVAEKVVVAGGVAVLLAIVAGVFISRNISRPVFVLADATHKMAGGNLTTRVQLNRKDEFGLLAETFNMMAARVENTVNTLRQFVGDAAHEINTPLTALRANLELTAGDEEMSASTRTDIQHALNELSRLEKLTRSLLVLARLETPSVPAQRDVIDLVSLFRQMHERYASRAEQIGIDLTVSVPEGPVSMVGDQTQITRMLDNLLDNAMKFTPDGGTVVLELTTTEDAVQITLRDTGIGIPESDLPKLFSRFHRGRNVAAYPGNGLGLVIAKAITEDHDGRIEVSSTGGGTCFAITLPCNQESDEA